MTLYEMIINAFPDLAENQMPFILREIVVQNDSDGHGDFIAHWSYVEPLPTKLEKYVRASIE